MPRGLVLFAGFEISLLSHPESPHHSRFLRFVFEGVAYQYTVLPFGLSLVPRTFTKCIDAALFPLRQMGIRILNYLDDWLILAQSEDEFLSHRFVLLSHLDCLGLNFAKSTLSSSQQISFLGTVIDSARMRAVVTPECALAIQQLAASFKLFIQSPSPSQSVSKDAGPDGLSVFGNSVGHASHAAPSVLAETSSSSRRLASRTPPCQGEPGL